MSNGPFRDSESARAAVSKARGKAATRIKDPKERREFIARQGKVETFGGGFAPIIRRTFLEHGKKGDATVAPKNGEFLNPSRSKHTVGIDSHVKYEK